MPRENTNQPPSKNDWESFRNIDNEEKAQILYQYLYIGGNMENVAMNLYGNSGYTQTNRISNVTRCYGFKGKNSKHFSNPKKHDYDLDINDFRAFVDAYSWGCEGDWPNHFTIDEFMEKRHLEKNNGYSREKLNEEKQEFVKNRNSLDKKQEQIGLLLIIGIIVIFLLQKVVEFIQGSMIAIGFYEICCGICFYVSIIYAIISIFRKKFKKSLKVILPLYIMNFVFFCIARGELFNAIILGIIAIMGYKFGVWIEKGNINVKSKKQTNQKEILERYHVKKKNEKRNKSREEYLVGGFFIWLGVSAIGNGAMNEMGSLVLALILIIGGLKTIIS